MTDWEAISDHRTGGGPTPEQRRKLDELFGAKYVAAYLKRSALTLEEQLDAGLIDMDEFRRCDARSARHRWGDWRTPKQRRIDDMMLTLQDNHTRCGGSQSQPAWPGCTTGPTQDPSAVSGG